MAFEVAVVFSVCQWVFPVGLERLAFVVGLLAGVCASYLQQRFARTFAGLQELGCIWANEVYGKLDSSWKTLGGNGAGFGKRICNCAQLGGLLCRRVLVPAQEMLRCAKVAKNYNITKSLKSCHSSVTFLLAGEGGSLHFSR